MTCCICRVEQTILNLPQENAPSNFAYLIIPEIPQNWPEWSLIACLQPVIGGNLSVICRLADFAEYFGDGLSGFLVEISFGYLDRISSGPGVRRGVCRGRSTRHKWELGLSKGGDEIDEPFGEIDLH